MSQNKTEPKATKPERVVVYNKRGAIARPLKEHLDTWLAAGWKLEKPTEKEG